MKLLIVDDEQNIREDVRTAIDWKSYGYEVCGEAGNGLEAIRMADEHRPDLVITDIRMPGLDGLEITERLKQSNPECKIIILTGYSEFQYAKQSIALGVESYLLKPIDEDELIVQVKKINDDIARERTLKSYIDDSRAVSIENMILSLVTGPLDDGLLAKANQICQLGLPWKSYQVLMADGSENGPMDRNLKNRLKKELTGFVSENNYGYVFESDGKLGVLLKDVSFDENIKPLEFLRNRLRNRQGTDVLLAIGSCTAYMDEIGLSYERAYNLIKNKFVWGSQKIVGYKKDIVADAPEESRGDTRQSMMEKLYMAVDLNNRREIRELLRELSGSFLHRNRDEAGIKSDFINVYFEIINRLMLNNGAQINLSPNNEIYTRRNLEELQEYLQEKLYSISDELARARPDTPMKKILDYIGRNYARDIKIENLARMFGYSSIYLGQLFKNHTGKYFNTYIEQLRIEKAKLLLKEGLKVYQAAQQTGYHNLDYFSSKFKKYVGVSPSEYRGEGAEAPCRG